MQLIQGLKVMLYIVGNSVSMNLEQTSLNSTNLLFLFKAKSQFLETL